MNGSPTPTAPSPGGGGRIQASLDHRSPTAPSEQPPVDSLPLDPALTTGRNPDRPAAEIPELHEVGCPDELRDRIEELMSRYPDRHSASIPALWAVQRRYGWCTPEGIRQAAAVMRVTPAYLESVASFYDLLHTEPAGRNRVLVCTNISCWMRGGDRLLDAFCEAAGCEREAAGHGGALSEDGETYVSGFECLGACDIAPMASIDERYYGPLEPGDAALAMEQLREGGEVLAGKALETRGAAGGPEPEPDPRLAQREQPPSSEQRATEPGGEA
jgi:NADH-quinone oxidoreductase subunit E